jgi:hypothetical protein
LHTTQDIEENKRTFYDIGNFPNIFTTWRSISCHDLFLSPEVIDEENFDFIITFLFSYSSNNTTISLSVQKLKRTYQGLVNIILNGKWRRVPMISNVRFLS